MCGAYDTDGVPSVYAGYTLSGGTIRCLWRDDAGTSIDASITNNTVWVNGTWHHIAITWNASTKALRVYADGVLENAATNAGFGTCAGYQSGDQLGIGAAGQGGTKAQHWNGKIEDFRLYDTVVIPDATIASIYNSGVGRVALSAGASGGPMELISTNGIALADSAPTESRLMILHENTGGTAVPNTDIKGWVSSDDGSTWDQETLVDIGALSGVIRMFAGTNVVTGASTNMKWKITSHGASNAGKVYGASMIWK